VPDTRRKEEQIMSTKPRIYVVWGPSPEWGDGVGVIGYALTKEDAQAILEDAAEEEREYGPRSWRTLHCKEKEGQELGLIIAVLITAAAFAVLSLLTAD
jgi:hypothetical protein